MSEILNVELELRQNYVDSDVTESIVRYVNAHGFDAQNVDELLLGLGYDEMFKEMENIENPQSNGK
ncbi:hypothetical protein KKC13_06335 [bacterium]|nr:hypothetical protein [bacterium]MBU1957477.1 hypothetical protein [bacterium]